MSAETATISPQPEAAGADWRALAMGALKHKSTPLILLVTGLVLFCFWPLMRLLPPLWFDLDSYYAHGVLIPICSAYIVYARWDRIRDLRLRGTWFALLPLLGLLYVAMIASRTVMPLVLSVVLIATLISAVWLVAGWRWMLALAPAILFLALGLPILDRVIDSTTQPLQLISTDTAYGILKLLGMSPFRDEPTIIRLGSFTLNVAVACSGLKTTIAVSATVIFFMLIAGLKWWANAILAVVAIPLSVVINGIRIAMIGLVGNASGSQAALSFHDYSGYIALIICFLLLGKLTRVLGYK